MLSYRRTQNGTRVAANIDSDGAELGLKLMKRSRGGVELTAEGEHVIGAVRGKLLLPASGCSFGRTAKSLSSFSAMPRQFLG